MAAASTAKKTAATPPEEPKEPEAQPVEVAPLPAAGDYVRVKQAETGHETTIPRARYDRNPDAWEPTGKEAVDSAGRPLPTKYHVLTPRRRQEDSASSGQQATTTEGA